MGSFSRYYPFFCFRVINTQGKNSFNIGDQTPISYINPDKYIQHNLAVGDGQAGFGEVMKNAPEGDFKANVVRAFQDGDFVFTHTEYDFFGPKAGFDVFRFEDGKTVEHWDNLAEITPPNPSGRTQLDGETEITDRAQTDANKKWVEGFVKEVLLEGKSDKLTTYVNPELNIRLVRRPLNRLQRPNFILYFVKFFRHNGGYVCKICLVQNKICHFSLNQKSPNKSIY